MHIITVENDLSVVWNELYANLMNKCSYLLRIVFRKIKLHPKQAKLQNDLQKSENTILITNSK